MEQNMIRFRHNVIKVNSLSAFINVKGGVNGNCRDVFFVRALGVSESLTREIRTMDESLGAEMLAGRLLYKRIGKLPVLSTAEDVEYYSRCYADWAGSGKKQMKTRVSANNEKLALTLGTACGTALEKFTLGKQGVSESMEKNFMVKMMYWFDAVMADLLKQWDERCYMKIASDNITKEQEYLFFYLLTLIGADVLLIQSEKDISSEPLKSLSEELLLGAYGVCQLPACQIHIGEKQSASPVIPQKAAGENIKMHLPERNRKKSGKEPRGEAGRKPIGEAGIEPRGEAGRESMGEAGREPRGEAGREKSFEELARFASSVVMIAVHNNSGEVVGTGSGIMIGPGGYILTNHHVICGGSAYSVRIEDDEKIYRTNEVIKYNSVLDLAILRIDRKLKPIPVYKGKQPLVRGQKVVAIGSPLGLFNSVSDGIISGFRVIDTVDMIQFTAPTSHGSSGGAVLNMQGEIIGMSTAGMDSGQNINLAMGYECINMFVKGFE